MDAAVNKQCVEELPIKIFAHKRKVVRLVSDQSDR